MTTRNDQLVADYLDAVRRATDDIPAGKRDELLADLIEHVAVARAELTLETEAAVRTILDRLGDRANIAAEARHGAETAAAASVAPVGPSTPAGSRRGLRALWITLAVILAVLVVMCLVGAAVYMARAGGAGGTVRPHDGPVATPSRSPT